MLCFPAANSSDQSLRFFHMTDDFSHTGFAFKAELNNNMRPN